MISSRNWLCSRNHKKIAALGNRIHLRPNSPSRPRRRPAARGHRMIAETRQIGKGGGGRHTEAVSPDLDKSSRKDIRYQSPTGQLWLRRSLCFCHLPVNQLITSCSGAHPPETRKIC